MKAGMCIPGVLLFICGFVPTVPFTVSVAASQKNTISALRKWKTTFRGTKRKSASIEFLAIPRATRVSDMTLFQKKLLHDQGQT
jgi:hypothetical protein